MTTQELIALIKKNPISFGCGALCVILIAVLYFGSDTVDDAKAQLDKLSTEGARLSANIEYSARLAEQYKTVSTANTIIDSRLVRASQLAQNLQYFYKLESDTSTKLTGLTQMQSALPKKGAPTTNFTPVGFSIVVDCDYAKALDVLHRLEDGEHYCRILDCNLSPKVSEGTGGVAQGMGLAVTLELEGQP
jgi:hypothetical protein